MQRRHRKQNIGLVALFLLTFTGMYNAIVINSESNIASKDIKFVKRLDEVYNVVTPGRKIATSSHWKKIPSQRVKSKKLPEEINASSSEVHAAIQEELDLNLVEVINPQKWKHGLSIKQFNGNLSTRNGIIESLSVTLPDGAGISISFSEMTGNVFEYDNHGQVLSGMMYQIDQYTFMITLTNGPLEGTRFRFSHGPFTEPIQNNVGSFGLDEPYIQDEFVAEYGPDLESNSFHF